MQSSNTKQLIFQYPNLVKYGNDHAYFPFNASQLMTHLARARELIFKPGVGRTELQEVPTQLFSGEITDHPDLAGWLLNIVGETIDAAIDGPHQGIRGTERTLESFLNLCEKRVGEIQLQNEGKFDNRTFQQLFINPHHYDVFIEFCERFDAIEAIKEGDDCLNGFRWSNKRNKIWLATFLKCTIDYKKRVFKEKVTQRIILTKAEELFKIKIDSTTITQAKKRTNRHYDEIIENLEYR